MALRTTTAHKIFYSLVAEIKRPGYFKKNHTGWFGVPPPPCLKFQFINLLILFHFLSNRQINAFIYDATVLEYLASHDNHCKLRTVGNWYATTGYGLGFPRGSKWIKVVNKYLSQLQHNGGLIITKDCDSLTRTFTEKLICHYDKFSL